MGGGIFHLFDFNPGRMARKILKHKRHNDGLEAPRNSLELQVEPSRSYSAPEDILRCYQSEEDWSEKNYYPFEAPMKKLINQEMCPSQQPKTKQNGPSIVARLMGVDTFPVEKTKHVVQPVEEKNTKSGKTERCSAAAVQLLSSKSKNSRQTEVDSVYGQDQIFGKTMPREHPQEEELQKFKKEFEAYQAKRLRECSNIIEEKFKTVKMNPYPNSAEKMSYKSMERTSLHHNRQKMEYFQDERKQWSFSRNRSMSADFEHPSLTDFGRKHETAPTRIVILRPASASDKFRSNDSSWTSSSDTLEEKGSIVNFLEEVKERLKLELQGKALKSSVVRGSGIETPFSEKATDPKQIAKHLANQVRENVGRRLLRSESTRSYKSEVQFNGPDSAEYRDARRFLSDRCNKQKQMSANEQSCWEITRVEEEMQTRSFRHGDGEGMVRREVSPRNLIRSLSAPVSGTSFGKLLLEDRHVITGAQIRRKHEGVDNASVRKRKKEKFSLKEKVSTIRYSFTLRRRLFGKKMQAMVESENAGRKIQAMVESENAEHDFFKDIASGPTVVMNFADRHENSTEVPPSPASVCSSTPEEFWRHVDHFSPVSTPDAAAEAEETATPQVFQQNGSNFNEVLRRSRELESECTEERTTDEEHEPMESEMIDIEDNAEAYIRDLLVASGLYDGKSNKSSSISNTVFEQVEESYKKSSKEDENISNDQNDHRMLLDLLNEVLPAVLEPPRIKLIDSSNFRPPRRRKLLESAWKIVRASLYPPADNSFYSLGSVVARDLESAPWCGLMDDESNVIGVELACDIFEDLVGEIVKDLCR